MLGVLLALVFVCAVGPAVLFLFNLRSYAAPPLAVAGAAPPSISVLIPARNEAANIGAALDCVLASRGVELEILVLDDASSDRTAEIVERIAARDARVQLLRSKTLPMGWNGKQFACWTLALSSAAPSMVFLDADVRLEPDAVARMAAFQRGSGAALVSGFPRLVTVGFLEWMLLPLIHFVLLGFLPVERMRWTTDPAMAAGCGQFMMVQREAYFASGGHEAIRQTMHDGLLLPRAFRRAGFRTDLADLTGLAKNATEGMAAPKRIVPVTLMLVLGQVVPTLVVVWGVIVAQFIRRHDMFVIGVREPWTVSLVGLCFLLALVASYAPRLMAVRRFRQPLKSAMLHPLGMVLLLGVQWYALGREVLGMPVGWRERAYASGSGAEVDPPIAPGAA